MKALLLLLAACASPRLPGMQAGDVLAIMAGLTPEGHDALVRALDEALGTRVMLADDALTTGSTLLIERRHLEGRDFGKPERFILVKNSGGCALIHERTQKRYALPGASCVEAR
jgi:hypothetical protein